MNTDLLSSIVYLFSAVPTSPSHDHLDVTIYENGFATSSTLATPILSDSGFSKVCVYPKLFVAIRSVLVHAAIRWSSVIPAYQIVDSLPEALFIIGECQVVFCRSELALLISADSAQGIISHCHLYNDSIPWDTLITFDAMTKPMVHLISVPVDPFEQFLNPEAFQNHDTATYEPMVQPNDLVNEYDGPLFDDWHSLANPASCESGSNTAEPYRYFHDHTYYPSMSMYSFPPGAYPVEYSTLDTISGDISVTIGEPSFTPFPGCPEIVTTDSFEDTPNSPSPSSTRSSPFPETPVFDNFRSELPHIVPLMSTVTRDVTEQEEQHTHKVTQIVHPTYPTSPTPVVALSPLSECESLSSSRCSSTAPSSQSSECGSTSSTSSEEILQVPVKVAGKKIRRTKTGAIRKKKAKSKEKHFCYYCNESFTRDHDAERHQRTCKSNPNCSQKEQCKICTKPLPVRLDARRRHWGTLECSDAARKLGFMQMDEERYELL
ncbi:hypothetical protein BDM02DRAFT_3191620 [Thelephora ganbajun]|uniref:Uncharacterized protein n=1 Tax=Thelephora ganbajun TaxID=370292 RepID=A0ACB6Z180_THEGA|nr:hypothetical protein BDM02DRAFT_3191620 [Thelephora ganbajun]